MDSEKRQKFWQEFSIVTQESDDEFPYANPSDAARSLVKARNWVGTITEETIALNDQLNSASRALRSYEHGMMVIERDVLARCVSTLPSWATKNKDVQKAYIWEHMNGDEKFDYRTFENLKNSELDHIDSLENEISTYTSMLKTLERATEWAIQYINWMKFEARTL